MLLEILYVVVTLVLSVLVVVSIKFRHAHGYWRRKKVTYVIPHPIFGSARDLFFGKRNVFDVMSDIYNELDGHPCGGFYVMDKPCFMLRDPEIIYALKVRDSDYFHDRCMEYPTTGDPLIDNYLRMRGQRLREIRHRFSQAFGPAKTERMFFLLEECANRTASRIDDRFGNGGCGHAELKDLMMRFTIDALGCCAFGIECGAIDGKHSQFLQHANQVMYPSRWFSFISFVVTWMPWLRWLSGSRHFSSDVYEFFRRVALETIQHRRVNNLRRDDVMHSLLEVKHYGFAAAEALGTEFSDDELVSQMFVLFLMGCELPTLVTSMALFEMALQPNIQNIARLEIDAVLKRHDGKMSYEAVREMTYLDMVVKETLRLHSPMASFLHECVRPYTVPGQSTRLEPGTLVVAPMLVLQRDPQYFSDPLAFDPRRFSPERREAILPGTYMPFGGGETSCVGKDFALTMVKVGLVSLLQRYEFGRCPKTPERMPAIDPRAPWVMVPAEGLWVRISPRSWTTDN